ncbi:MAG: transposase [bacterium]|nr:transposase [bacterium]
MPRTLCSGPILFFVVVGVSPALGPGYTQPMGQHKQPAPPPPGGIQDPRRLAFSPGRSRGRLPHLEKHGCTYFVTFCLAAVAASHSSPRRKLNEYAAPADIALYSEPSKGSRHPLLVDERLAAIVEAALLHFQEQRYALHAWVVMPDHVHLAVTPYTHTLAEVLRSWKSFASHRINDVLHRSGRVWQSESFDHIVRSNHDYERFVEYVERNPVKANLCSDPADWPFSSARFRSE